MMNLIKNEGQIRVKNDKGRTEITTKNSTGQNLLSVFHKNQMVAHFPRLCIV